MVKRTRGSNMPHSAKVDQWETIKDPLCHFANQQVYYANYTYDSIATPEERARYDRQQAKVRQLEVLRGVRVDSDDISS
jgi:hypothetical protein